MPTWNQRMLPYPLLAPWTHDYEDPADFGVEVCEAEVQMDGRLLIRVKFHLTSDTLLALAECERAVYVLDVECPRTFVRNAHRAERETTLSLEFAEYAEELTVTPYLAALEDIPRFVSDEHAAEWRVHNPAGSEVPAAGILAVGNSLKVLIDDIQVRSVLDLVSNPALDSGLFDVHLDDARIKIHVSPSDKERIDALRGRAKSEDTGYAGLYPGLYLHAVTEALRNLSRHEGTRWAFTMRNALEQKGLGEVDTDTIEEAPLHYAQKLLGHPLGSFLDTALTDPESE